MLGLTRWWPTFIRVKYYLPKMHQGAVKPEGAAESATDPEAGEGGSAAQASQAPTVAAAAGTAAAAAAVAAATSGNPLPLLQGAATGQLLPPPPTVMPLGGMASPSPAGYGPSPPQGFATPTQAYGGGPYPLQTAGGPPMMAPQIYQPPSPNPQQKGVTPPPIMVPQISQPPSPYPQQGLSSPQPVSMTAERV